ncbi:interleukin-27 receptor subunit alpha [Mantella aurantiaca]
MSDDWRVKSLVGGLLILIFGISSSKGNTDECSLCCIIQGVIEDLNCTWTNNSSLQPSVFLQSITNPHEFPQHYTVPPGQKWLLIRRGNLTAFHMYQLTVNGGTWVATLNFTYCHECENVFIEAPVLSSPVHEDNDTFVDVTWEHKKDLSHHPVVELRYRILGDHDWILVNSGDLEPNSYSMTDPEPYTDYEFQIRYIPGEQQKSRSLWSESYVLTTPEEVPVGTPDIWRRVDQEESLLVIWKPLSAHSARGKILSYYVTYIYNNTLQTTEKPCCNVTMPAQSTHVCVSARNSVGLGPHSCVTPLCSEPPDQDDFYGKALGNSSGHIAVWWKESMIYGFHVNYLVEWRKNNSFEMDWTRSQTANQTLGLPGEFSPGVLYLISIYALYNDSCVKVGSTEAYAKEEVPLTAPTCSIHVLSSSEVSISWNEIPSHNLRGKLKHYTIYVNSTIDSHKYTVLNTTLTLSSLLPNTWYNIFITASTAAGEGMPSAGQTFQTKGVRNLHPLALPCMSLLGVCVLGALIFIHPHVRKTLLLALWPKIPKPENKLNGAIASTLLESQQPPPNPPITEVEEMKPASPPSPPPPASPPSPPPAPRPDQRKAVTSGYEKHFMPTPEEVMSLC